MPPAIHTLKSESPGPRNLTIFGNRLITDVINQDEVILEGAYSNRTDVLIKRGNFDTQEETEETGSHLSVREHQWLAEAREEAWDRSFHRARRRCIALPTL